MRKSLSSILVAVLFIMGTAAGVVRAEPPYNPPIRLVTGDDYPPFVSGDLPEGGMITALVTQVFGALGFAVQLKVLPWERARLMLERGEFDAAFPYIHTVDRDQKFRFSAPLFRVEEVIWTRPDLRPVITGPSSLVGLNLCLPVGYAASPALQPMISDDEINVTSPLDWGNCPRMVVAGRADFLLLNDLVVAEMMRRAQLREGQLIASKILFNINGLHLIAPRSQPRSRPLLMDFDRKLADFRRDGRYTAIVRRYAPGTAVLP